jgi:hypothetical protein
MSAKKNLKPPKSPFIKKSNKGGLSTAQRGDNRSSAKMTNDI